MAHPGFSFMHLASSLTDQSPRTSAMQEVWRPLPGCYQAIKQPVAMLSYSDDIYKARAVPTFNCDISMDNEHYYAETIARYLVDSAALDVPLELSAVCDHLTRCAVVPTGQAALSALKYLNEQLPSSVVIDKNTCSQFEILTSINADMLALWLATLVSHRNPSQQMEVDDDDESLSSSWDSEANNTALTSFEDYCEATYPLNYVKPQSVRQLLASELSRISSTLTSIDSLCSDFDTLLHTPTYSEHQAINTAINRSTLTQFVQLCPHNNPSQCQSLGRIECRDKVHLERVVSSTTDESLGDCNYLDTCFKGRGCHYVHYRVQLPANRTMLIDSKPSSCHFPDPQWIQCNLQQIDLAKMGNDYGVIIADPPWDIHMSASKTGGGTIHDDDIAHLPVQSLQTEGIIFLWVTGRALDAGRQCLKTWGYTHTEELVWLKINQLGRTIGTGRTGHWLNHTKEHVLVGVKGKPSWLKRQLDVDSIVSASRGNSKKPEELYSIIDRIAGNSVRKIELFGRENNLRPGWLTLGTELRGTQLNDPLLKFRWARASK